MITNFSAASDQPDRHQIFAPRYRFSLISCQFDGCSTAISRTVNESRGIFLLCQ